MDVDPERGVMLHSDFIYYADTLDCIISFCFFPNLEAHVQYDLVSFCCTIQSHGLSCTIQSCGLSVYDINL